MKGVDPKYLRNLKFSKKHNVRNPKVGGRVAKPVRPAVVKQVAKPAPVKAVPAKTVPAKAAKPAAAAKPQKK